MRFLMQAFHWFPTGWPCRTPSDAQENQPMQLKQPPRNRPRQNPQQSTHPDTTAAPEEVPVHRVVMADEQADFRVLEEV